MRALAKPAPRVVQVVEAVAGGARSSVQLRDDLGVSATAVAHAVSRARARGWLRGWGRDGSLEVTEVGLAFLGDGISGASAPSRRPVVKHLILALIVRGVSTLHGMALCCPDRGYAPLESTMKRLVAEGLVARVSFGGRVRITDDGYAALRVWDARYGVHEELPTPVVLERARKAEEDWLADRMRRRRLCAARACEVSVAKRAARGRRASKGQGESGATAAVRASGVAASGVSASVVVEVSKPEVKAPVRLGAVVRRRPLPTEGWV